MDIINRFEAFAAAFEKAVEGDGWRGLTEHLTEDATYLNVGSADPKCKGRDAVIAFLKADVENTDSRFETRTLIALTPPAIEGNRLTRKWRCTYALTGTPDLIVDGEARYVFAGDLISEIEEEVTPESVQNVDEWMQNYADRLRG